jgi:ABC-type bacteriocin/lantibiotic exporter with double-glycine peptidase domain
MGEVVATLPTGIMTVVGIGGQGVSGGQAQRIQLARLAYHETPFVLIDEGTSALDPETEQAVFRLVEQLAGRGTGVIMIAHRLAATAIADEVLVLDRGRLVMSGPAAEVTKTSVFHELAGTAP